MSHQRRCGPGRHQALTPRPVDDGGSYTNARPHISEDRFVYVPGLTILISHAGRFWLGFALALLPIATGIATRP